MKKLNLLAVAAIILFNLACTPDKCCVPPGSEQYLAAMKDGVQWFASPNDCVIKGDSITIGGVYPSATIQDHFRIRFKYTGPGVYALSGNDAVYDISSGAAINKYTLDNAYENALHVTAYDEGSNIIKGTFNFKFSKTPDSPPTTAADALSFLDGKFQVRLQK